MRVRGQFRVTPALALIVAGCAPATITIPFDSKANQIAVDASVRGERVTMILDTAVTPSVLDLGVARSLGLLADETASGEASGTGTDTAAVYPTELRDLRLGRLKVDRLEAVAFDMQPLSRKFGRPLHGILGDSFLKGRTVLIDYSKHRVTLFRTSADAERAVANCLVRYRQPLDFVPGDIAPKLVISIGRFRVPVSLDTGSALGLELYDGALPSSEAARLLSDRTSRTVTGARGEAAVSESTLGEAVELGPFRWDRPTIVLSGPKGSAETRLGNMGNRFLDQKTLLLDYQGMMLGLYEGCGRVRSPPKP